MMIIFERTANNKSMPCDTPSVFYRLDPKGADTILNERGEIVRGHILHDRPAGSDIGYVPHFVTCKKYKKKAPAKQAKPKPPPKPQEPEIIQQSLFN
jgi:hypothetical protein